MPRSHSSRLPPLLLAFFAAALENRGVAHPAVSVVQDSRGNVYYSDLKQVWRIAPDGKKSVAVAGVHAHELCVDAADNLYGEHLWYEGEKTDKWGYRVWRLSRDGKLTDIVPAREGFRQEPSFVRDGSGAQYWTVEEGALTTFKRKSSDGRVSDLARERLGDRRWMTAARDGTLYFVDGGDLRRVRASGEVETVARNLAERQVTNPRMHRHDVMGLWMDVDGNVYVAVTAGRKVKKVSPAGNVSVVATSRFPWAPTGGMVDGQGRMWILEWGLINGVRVRRVAGNGSVTLY